ncbi:hypothetical protein V6N12_045038 [Hibiscus sabdariffa]|uniref:Uncharacterized protein n=1 Tax=Hibiscus sabdariffa TaxID=183260 RepID=A0ABR2G1N6_9ROSI
MSHSETYGSGLNQINWRQLFDANENQSLHYFPPRVNDGGITVKLPIEMFDGGRWFFNTSLKFIEHDGERSQKLGEKDHHKPFRASKEAYSKGKSALLR